MAKREDTLKAIQTALGAFTSGSLANSTKGLLNALEYDSDKTFELSPNTYQGFYEDFAGGTDGFSTVNARADEWTSADIIFQVADEDLNQGQASIFSAGALQRDRYNSFLFMAIGLRGESYTRTDLAKITREVNKCLPMPVVILFQHGSTLTLAVIQRRQNLNASDKDVLAKVTLIKDINSSSPHRAHLEILTDLSLDSLADREKHRISNFETLFAVWQKVLDTTELNKRFYRELSNWYFWALPHARFPKLPDEDSNRNEVALIRLITRLIFVWFLKEKNLVPDSLFDRDRLNALLTSEHHIGDDGDGDGDGYYQAILQNLFFATLNTEMNATTPESRGFKKASKKGQGINREYMTHTRYRYQNYFADADAALKLFENVPFLNGGLFECLDRAAAESPSGKEERIDGFSDDPRKQAQLPDKLFFGKEDVDLNKAYGTKNKRPEHVRGILNIFNSYKFTVDENTPIEEEVALDPELLGKVFENLLASYNPETETTARKQTGSFYTPREIVNYMVDESLIAYFAGKLTQAGMKDETAQEKLRELFGYLDKPHEFTESEVATLISAIDAVKILDPACGSGAFPMGVLLRLVELLGQLDPDNERWQEQQLERLIAPVTDDKQQAEKIGYDKARESAIAELDERLKEIRAAFAENDHNYARKLFLIENCIYGVDIQPIAVQIAKLRFFVTLVVDQHAHKDKKNRGILALPNLETKFVAANTLLSLDTQTGLTFPEVAEKEKELEQVRSDHFNARRYADKEALRAKDKKLRGEIEVLLAQSGFGKEVAHQLASWNPYDQSSAANFFDARWMFDANDGFDVVIGNPPYVRHEQIKELKPSLKTRYESFTGTADIYVYFFERGVKLLREGGVLTYICSNKYFRSAYGQKLREFLGTKTAIKQLIDFGDAPVFTAIAYPSILTTVRGRPRDNTLRALSWEMGQPLEEFSNVWETQSFIMPQTALTADGWRLKDTAVRTLLEKIRAAGTPLGEYVNGRFYYGIKTGLNEAFVVNRETRDRLIAEHPSSAGVLKPFLRGRDVKRWQVNFADQYLIKIESSENKKHSWSGKPDKEAEATLAKTYPAIYRHFQDYRDALIKRQDQGKYFWELRSCAYWTSFEEPKIVLGIFMNRPTYAFDSEGFFHNNALHMIAGASEHVAAVLNSAIGWWYLRQICTDLQNGYLQAYQEKLAQIPVPNVAIGTSDNISVLVNYIACLSKASTTENRVIVSYLERILDGMVYELYLSDELHAAGRHIIKHVEAEHLPALDELGGDKLAALQGIFERLYAKDHPVRENLYFLDSLEAVRIIEGKA